MVIDQIRARLEQKPFRPFIVESSGGNLIPVERPDWVFFPPDLDQIVIFTTRAAWHFSLGDIKGVGVE
jgi:hypothetical protein